MKQCTCYALRAIDCTCKPAKYGELYTSPTAKQEQGELVAWEKILGAVARGWCHEENANKTMDIELAMAIVKEVKALYTTPQQRKPLTDEQREEISKGWQGRNWTVGDIIDAIEAAHGIKE